MLKNANFEILYIYMTHIYVYMYIIYNVCIVYAVVFIEWIKGPGGRSISQALQGNAKS